MSASNRVEILQSQTLTGSGSSGAIPVNSFIAAIIGLDITAKAGTTLVFNIWAQVSDDGGTTWYDLCYDRQRTSDPATADLTANTIKRNINGTANFTEASAVAKSLANYDTLAADFIRLTWVLTGTGSPSVTLSASLVGK